MTFHIFVWNANKTIVLIHGMLNPWMLWQQAMLFKRVDDLGNILAAMAFKEGCLPPDFLFSTLFTHSFRYRPYMKSMCSKKSTGRLS